MLTAHTWAFTLLALVLLIYLWRAVIEGQMLSAFSSLYGLAPWSSVAWRWPRRVGIWPHRLGVHSERLVGMTLSELSEPERPLAATGYVVLGRVGLAQLPQRAC